MSTYTFRSTPSPKPAEARNNWTVSPEFGDALLTAMRERSQTGGPLPRLPSLLQLSSAQVTETPSTKTSPIKLDSAERLKMKTRVAIRDKNGPHRFQVVSLRDAGHYSSNDQMPPRDSKFATGMPTRSPGAARSNRQSWKRLRTDENTAPSAESYLKTATPERFRKPLESNKNVPSADYSPSELLAKMPRSHHTTLDSANHSTLPLRSLGDQPLAETNRQQNEPTQSSNLEAKTYSGRQTLHFKSPSLGNLRTKSDLDPDSDTTPLSQVTCRKRTNTLSADHHRCFGAALATNADPPIQHDRRNLVKKDSVKRHAIYTQSLYVAVNERPNLPSEIGAKRPLDETSQLCAFPFRSSIPTSRNKPDLTSRRSAHTSSALGFINVPIGPVRSLEHASDSRFSISSVYSQDELSLPSQAALMETRPLTCLGPPSDFGQVVRHSTLHEAPIQHHPIVLMLLVEVEKAMQEWSAI